MPTATQLPLMVPTMQVFPPAARFPQLVVVVGVVREWQAQKMLVGMVPVVPEVYDSTV
jgi:hypothetical protein